MKPKISIIIPVYNIELYISDCLDSILGQTFTDYEVIVINDGSKDHSGHICEDYASRDERIKVIHKAYGGVSAARNAGLERATGDYIGFVDGDDRIKYDMYERLHELCVQTNSDISICTLGREINGKLINPDNGLADVTELDHDEALRELFKGTLYRFSLCNKLFKARCFKNIQFPEGRIHEDLSTTYKLFANSRKSVFIDKVGYLYIKRENSILTSQYSEKRMDSFIGWNEILPFMSKYYEELSEEVFACFAYWSVDNIYYILNQVKSKQDKRNYLRRIQASMNTYYPVVMKKTSLPLKYRTIIRLLHHQIGLLLFINRLRRI